MEELTPSVRGPVLKTVGTVNSRTEGSNPSSSSSNRKLVYITIRLPRQTLLAEWLNAPCGSRGPRKGSVGSNPT